MFDKEAPNCELVQCRSHLGDSYPRTTEMGDSYPKTSNMVEICIIMLPYRLIVVKLPLKIGFINSSDEDFLIILVVFFCHKNLMIQT